MGEMTRMKISWYLLMLRTFRKFVTRFTLASVDSSNTFASSTVVRPNPIIRASNNSLNIDH